MWKMYMNGKIKLNTLKQKGEIAYYELFLLLPQCFQKSSAAEASEIVRVKPTGLSCF